MVWFVVGIFLFFNMKISQWLNVGNYFKKCFQHCSAQMKPSVDHQFETCEHKQMQKVKEPHSKHKRTVNCLHSVSRSRSSRR